MPDILTAVEPLLTGRGLQRTLEGRTLWRDLHFTVNAGDCLAITGPSGSGKSLLLRAICGLDPVEGGNVTFQTRDQHQWAMPEYRAQVMYVSQKPPLLAGTVEDNLRQPWTLRVRQARTYPVDEATRLLGAFGRTVQFLQQDASRLSGGEGQILALTRALLLSPTILLLDEATSALDPEAVGVAEQLIQTWRAAATNRAVVFVSHDPEQRVRLATRELELRQFQSSAP